MKKPAWTMMQAASLASGVGKDATVLIQAVPANGKAEPVAASCNLLRFALSDSSRTLGSAFSALSATGDYIQVGPPTLNRMRRVVLDAAYGEGFWDFHVVEPGLYMVVVCSSHRSPVIFKVPGENLIQFHFHLHGRLAMSGQWGSIELSEPAMLLWKQGPNCEDVVEELGGCGQEVWAALIMEPDVLERHFDALGVSVPSDLIDLLKGHGHTTPQYRIIAPSNLVSASINALLRPEPDAFFGTLVKAKSYELLYFGLNALAGDYKPTSTILLRNAQAAKIDAVRCLIEQNYSSRLTIKIIAQKIGINEHFLKTAFKARYGCGVHAYLTTVRLAAAHSMIRDQNVALAEVARSVGFKHPSSFTTAFKAQYGFSPRQLRSC